MLRKKLLIILLLIVGCVFADTMVIETRTAGEKEVKVGTYEIMGEYVGILDGKAYLRVRSGKLTEFNCDDVIRIFDDDRKPISWDCNESSFVPKALTELDIEQTSIFTYLGAFCIAYGGYLLHTYPDDPFCSDCEDNDDFNDHIDSKKFQWRAGIIFISLGGILVAFGI